MRGFKFLSVLLVLSMILAACGGGGAPAAAPAEQAAPAGEAAAEEAPEAEATAIPGGETYATVTEGSDILPPVLVEPCEPGSCPFEGQTVTVIVNTAGSKGPISGPFYEVREEFEAATGATLEIVEVPEAEHFPKLMTDVTTGTGQYDTSINRAPGGLATWSKAISSSLTTITLTILASRSGTMKMSSPARASCWSMAARNIWSPTTMTARSCTIAAI